MSLSCPRTIPASVALSRPSPFSSRQQPSSNAGSGRKPPVDQAIRHWLGAFHQFHSEDGAYSPIALRLEPTDAEVRSQNSSANRSAPQLATDRHVYEVALRQDARGETWVLIDWQVDVPGIMFCDCADRDEVMALFADPAQATGRWYGARLRPDHRPW